MRISLTYLMQHEPRAQNAILLYNGPLMGKGLTKRVIHTISLAIRSFIRVWIEKYEWRSCTRLLNDTMRSYCSRFYIVLVHEMTVPHCGDKREN